MKKVIDGKLYNTETADRLHDWNNRCPCSDFQYCEEALYRTKKGAFFLAGSGGPMSKYAQAIEQNSWGGGEGLEPLSTEEALNWAETHDMDPDEIAEIWPVEEA